MGTLKQTTKDSIGKQIKINRRLESEIKQTGRLSK